MTKKKNAETVAGFGIHQNLNKFLNSFNPKRNNQKFQCLNCEDWKPGNKSIAVGQFNIMAKKAFIFRFCRPCWKSYQSVTPELRKDFIANIRGKISKVMGVKNG